MTCSGKQEQSGLGEVHGMNKIIRKAGIEKVKVRNKILKKCMDFLL